jgi:hypothetical protein
VRKHILETRSPDSKFALLRYDLALPFVPFTGLALHEGRWTSGRIEDVTYGVEKSTFDCRVENEYAQSDDGDIDFDFLVQDAVAQGWKLIAVRTPRPDL